MKWISRLVFLVIFALLFVFFLLNQHSVYLHYYREMGVNVSVAIALTISLIIGVVIGYATSIGKIMRLRSELKRLSIQLQQR